MMNSKVSTLRLVLIFIKLSFIYIYVYFDVAEEVLQGIAAGVDLFDSAYVDHFKFS